MVHHCPHFDKIVGGKMIEVEFFWIFFLYLLHGGADAYRVVAGHDPKRETVITDTVETYVPRTQRYVRAVGVTCAIFRSGGGRDESVR